MFKRILMLLIFAVFISSLFFSADQNLTEKERNWLEKAGRYEKNGWIYLHIEGEPFERGFQRGYLTANEISELLETLAHTAKYEHAKDLNFFVETAVKLFEGKVSKEYILEMQGMVAGIEKAGKKITFEEILFMNGYIDILWYWWPEEKELKEKRKPGCSAFIATGDATIDGGIVMAHNTWSHYNEASFSNIIIDLAPDKGNRILMQSAGPIIYSAMDFFMTEAGIVGTETTIGYFHGFDSKGTPVFERARKAMQYARNIDEWAKIMTENNNGAYANSWLLGDISTSEIARLELGLKNHSLEKKRKGYFSGSNITDNLKILREETDAPYDDIRESDIARRERWKKIIQQHYGKINVETAKIFLSDHYDVYLMEEKPGIRTICGHGDLDSGHIPGNSWTTAYMPIGAHDGKVVDTDLAKKWQFWAKWGSSCDSGFDAKMFLEKHTQYDWMEGYLKDLPAMPWTIVPFTEKE